MNQGPDNAIVSIGTGKSQEVEPGKRLFGVMKNLATRWTNTEAKHHEFLRRHVDLQDRYFRLQAPSALGKIDLAASKKVDGIERLAGEYLTSKEGRDLIAKCALKLHGTS